MIKRYCNLSLSMFMNNVFDKHRILQCQGNYNGEPYSQMVKFPSRIKEEEEWKERITAIPNPLKSLLKRKEIYICQKHFHPDCKWKQIRGGKHPDEPPSIFENVPSSCLKQRKTRR